MSQGSPIMRYFVAADALLEHVEPAWWGAVVTDSRFPSMYDVNYARVEHAAPDLTFAEIEGALLTALRAAGARQVHVVMFEPEGVPLLLGDLESRGHRIHFDMVMERRRDVASDARPDEFHEVVEVDPLDPEVMAFRREALPALHDEPGSLDEYLRWEDEVMAPAGRRWFAVRLDGRLAGGTELDVAGGVGYLDNVVTLPFARRRGIAAAVVDRVVREAWLHGAEHVCLLADEPGPIRLYERLGFDVAGRLGSASTALKS